ncbi:OB-fold protein [Robbsia andropogonis]|uniref:OB-fold protein n=1 Tax=Robbsia andropogonis TaxID=28092 RepID=UPI003D22C207
MALIKCSECGTEISDSAAACVKCGAPIEVAKGGFSGGLPALALKAGNGIGKSLAIIVGLFVLAIVVAGVMHSRNGGGNQGDSATQVDQNAPFASGVGDSASAATTMAASATPSQPASPPAQREVIPLTAYALYDSYHANEVSADDKYKGKWLYVEGTVSEIGKDFLDKPYVNVYGTEKQYDFNVVRARFSKSDLSSLSKLSKGMSINLMCKGDGMVVGDPVLDCTSNDVPPVPQVAKSQGAFPASGASVAPPPSPAPTDVQQNAPTFTTSFDCSKAKSDAGLTPVPWTVFGLNFQPQTDAGLSPAGVAHAMQTPAGDNPFSLR